MIILCKNAELCHIIAFFIKRFGSRAFETIPDKIKGFKFVTDRFHNITVIDVNDWFFWISFTDSSKIRFKCNGRSVVV